MKQITTRKQLDASYKEWEALQHELDAGDHTRDVYARLQARSIEIERAWDSAAIEGGGVLADSAPIVARKMLTGWLFRPGSLWMGGHWSPHNKRLCINIIPCITFWVTFKGGNIP